MEDAVSDLVKMGDPSREYVRVKCSPSTSISGESGDSLDSFKMTPAVAHRWRKVATAFVISSRESDENRKLSMYAAQVTLSWEKSRRNSAVHCATSHEGLKPIGKVVYAYDLPSNEKPRKRMTSSSTPNWSKKLAASNWTKYRLLAMRRMASLRGRWMPIRSASTI